LKDNILKSKRNYLLIWAALGLVLCTLDYYDHISRNNQIFEHFKIRWLLFSVVSFIVLFSSIIIFNLSLNKIIKHHNLKYLKEIISLFLGVGLYQFLGQWINQLIIPEVKLHFKFDVFTYFIAGIIYTLVYIVYNHLSIFFKSKLKVNTLNINNS
jgi:hypothetical protein